DERIGCKIGAIAADSLGKAWPNRIEGDQIAARPLLSGDRTNNLARLFYGDWRLGPLPQLGHAKPLRQRQTTLTNTLGETSIRRRANSATRQFGDTPIRSAIARIDRSWARSDASQLTRASPASSQAEIVAPPAP